MAERPKLQPKSRLPATEALTANEQKGKEKAICFNTPFAPQLKSEPGITKPAVEPFGPPIYFSTPPLQAPFFFKNLGYSQDESIKEIVNGGMDSQLPHTMATRPNTTLTEASKVLPTSPPSPSSYHSASSTHYYSASEQSEPILTINAMKSPTAPARAQLQPKSRVRTLPPIPGSASRPSDLFDFSKPPLNTIRFPWPAAKMFVSTRGDGDEGGRSMVMRGGEGGGSATKGEQGRGRSPTKTEESID